jgi:hypothetical protein
MAISRHVAALFLVGVLTGCISVEGSARNHFAWAHSCPLDRVAFREPPPRPQEAPPEPVHATPPPDIAADPQRLAMFRETERRENELRVEQAEYRPYIIEISGCGVVESYDCQISCANFGRCCTPLRR